MARITDMKDEDQSLREALQDEQQRMDAPAPDFAAVWAAAEAQARPRHRFAAPVAVALIAIIAVTLLLPDDDPTYVDVEELLTSTSWIAPSDTLLPQHQFDIFREIPRLIESTESADGALL
jgi:hypothetical protein